MTTVDMGARAGRREWMALAVLCLPTLLTTVDISVLILALPRLATDLGASGTQQLWVTDIYGFMIAGFLVLMGTLGDRIGHRNVLLGGAVGFMVASLLAAYSTSIEMLLVSRALLGISAATVMPCVLALIAQLFPNPAQMGAAMGVWGTSIMLGVILGPVVGGLLLGSFWWGSIFLMGVPVMALLLLVGPGLLPAARHPHPGRLDPLSALLTLAALLPVVYGLKEIARAGWAAMPLGAIVVGLAFGLMFVHRQRHLTHPMLDLALFRNPVVSTIVLLGLAFGFITAGAGLVSTLYMQLVADLTPLKVALWMLIPAGAMIIGGNIGPAVARTVRPAYVLAAGMVLAAVGALVVTQVNVSGGLATLIVGLVVMYVGGSPSATLANAVLMSSTPPEKAGAAGSLSSTGGELGVALGVAVLGSVAGAVYGSAVDVPAAVPPEAAIPAGESIVGAAAVADTLPEPVAAELLDSAREAFTQALHGASLINLVLFLAVAVLLATRLKSVPPTGTGHPGMPPEAAPPAP
ncbi:MFS transporter [Micromonospora eburnea]|uniref:MFS transporter, DHA2 family, multidrug resistance protein n=1 Tax=Micromonospora eburnea TaxID=227316 RepID=A0A1C6UTK0_9ACTN|nr:MFS transporter [Micromonospora eburnea]SCL57308.1 MFS transporter, DHA2 family, multidrug resistance protein [Micromonospora eburnea]